MPTSADNARANARATPRRAHAASRVAGVSAPERNVAVNDAAGVAEGTRQAVLAVALNEFAAKGLAGARVDEIAAKAGVNKQALYYHFGSKDDLFRVTLERGYSQIRENNERLSQAVAGLAPLEAMKYLIRSFFDRVAANLPMVAIILDENRYAGMHLTNRELIRSATQPLIEVASTILAEGAKRGVFAPDIDAEQFYVDLVSLCMFYFSDVFTLSALLGRDLKVKSSIAARREHVVKFMCLALRPEAPSPAGPNTAADSRRRRP